MNRRFLGPLVAIGVFAAMFFYNQRQDSIIRWNDQTLEVIAPLQAASYDVEISLEPWFEGQPINLHEAEEAMQAYAATLDRCRSDLDALPPPNQDPTTVAFADSTRAYLKHFQDAHDLYAEVIAQAQSGVPANPDTVTSTEQRLFKIVEEGARIVVTLQSNQQAFAKEHDFRLE